MEYSQNISMRLSEVMNDIGVNEEMILRRRKTFLLSECTETVTHRLQNKKFSTYYLGSQTEGTTTAGLFSDFDLLTVINKFNIIQDWSEWEPNVSSYMMIQNESVSPGYCLLQRCREDAPLAHVDVPNEHHLRERTGRILLKNTMISSVLNVQMKGPSQRVRREGFDETDIVYAFCCKSWPVQARVRLDQFGVERWPSVEMKLFSRNSGCFVVAVPSWRSENAETEWRISTSLAERCLMLNLNITQIRCYILMKMLLKSYINPQFQDTLSSFMCKTILFHCVQNTYTYRWHENNLLPCLNMCLIILYNFISSRSCPHFFIPENNLMRGKISDKIQPRLLETILKLIQSNGKLLLSIHIGDIGSRLWSKFSTIHEMDINFSSPVEVCALLSGGLTRSIAVKLSESCKRLLRNVANKKADAISSGVLKHVHNLVYFHKEGNVFEKTVCTLLAPFLCTTVGSVLASNDMTSSNSISPRALTWFYAGLNSDVSSGRLKLASVFYCIGNLRRTKFVIKGTEQNYNIGEVESVCRCFMYPVKYKKEKFCLKSLSFVETEKAIRYTTAFCVRFLPCEINCVPKELRYEMFRSNEEDRTYRGEFDYWMDWAVVDSIVYLYFLQYKTYGHLGRCREQQQALTDLIWSVENELNLGHRETARNLLGQCLEQENREEDALRCYLKSLALRRRNNVAKIHICRLLACIVNTRTLCEQSPNMLIKMY